MIRAITLAACLSTGAALSAPSALAQDGTDTPAATAAATPDAAAVGAVAARRGNYDLARTKFAEACEAGDLVACVDLGHLHRQGLGGDQDYEAAFALFREACEGRIATACHTLAYHHFEGRGLPEVDHERARQYYTRACDLGDSEACAGLGNMEFVGLGGARERLQGADRLHTACNTGSQYACDKIEQYGIRRR